MCICMINYFAFFALAVKNGISVAISFPFRYPEGHRRTFITREGGEGIIIERGKRKGGRKEKGNGKGRKGGG